jgi:hypothetical protein
MIAVTLSPRLKLAQLLTFRLKTLAFCINICYNDIKFSVTLSSACLGGAGFAEHSLSMLKFLLKAFKCI